MKDKSINGWRFDFHFSWTETWACLLALAVKKKGGRDFVLQGREEESEKDGGVSTIHTVATGRILTFLLLLGPSWQSQLATKAHTLVIFLFVHEESTVGYCSIGQIIGLKPFKSTVSTW